MYSALVLSIFNFISTRPMDKKYRNDIYRIVEHTFLCTTSLFVTDQHLSFLAEKIVAYLLLDTLILLFSGKVKSDFMLHHIGGILFFYNHEYFKITPILRELALFELSSIFLSIRGLLFNVPNAPKKIVLLNNLLFFFTFAYVRLYHGFYKTIFPSFPNVPHSTKTIGIGFLGLNLYWFVYIIKLGLKHI